MKKKSLRRIDEIFDLLLRETDLEKMQKRKKEILKIMSSELKSFEPGILKEYLETFGKVFDSVIKTKQKIIKISKKVSKKEKEERW